jgi:hypothetical protein
MKELAVLLSGGANLVVASGHHSPITACSEGTMLGRHEALLMKILDFLSFQTSQVKSIVCEAIFFSFCIDSHDMLSHQCFMVRIVTQ